ncbi:AMP-dependent synthetase and ligase [Hymenopellis radicata]|nr:AMP-dependent synthetase and ligase [Hymenopellis radicata]
MHWHRRRDLNRQSGSRNHRVKLGYLASLSRNRRLYHYHWARCICVLRHTSYNPANDWMIVNIVLKSAQNPLLFLLRAARIYPDKVALAHPDVAYPRSYTFAIWTQRIQNLAYALIQRGVKPGDRVADYVSRLTDACQGILAARGVATLINTRLTPPEVEYILTHSGASLAIVDEECLPLMKGCRVPTIVSRDTGLSDDPYEVFLTEGRRFSQERGWQGLDVDADENAPALLCYTSGTTGRPKGVLTTLRGTYLAAISNAFEGRINKDSVYLWILPMFHAGGWTYPWSNTFAFATQITLRTVNYPLIWKHFLHSGVSHYCGAPTVQIGIVNDPKARKLPQPITAIIAGAAPTASLVGNLESKGFEVVHTYGPFTRGYPQDSWRSLSLEDRSKLIARQGHSFATAEDVRVVEMRDDDRIIDVTQDGNTTGEIVTRGNIRGYFRSGDLAVWHSDGAIAVVDRSKDIIISGGENASSLAIEQELSSHPHVLEVSVVARPHPTWGERPMAFVKLHPEHAAKWVKRDAEFSKTLKEHARTRLPGFACPEWVLVVDELPKTSTGKILKTDLRKRAAKL